MASAGLLEPLQPPQPHSPSPATTTKRAGEKGGTSHQFCPISFVLFSPDPCSPTERFVWLGLLGGQAFPKHDPSLPLSLDRTRGGAAARDRDKARGRVRAGDRNSSSARAQARDGGCTWTGDGLSDQTERPSAAVPCSFSLWHDGGWGIEEVRVGGAKSSLMTASPPAQEPTATPTTSPNPHPRSHQCWALFPSLFVSVLMLRWGRGRGVCLDDANCDGGTFSGLGGSHMPSPKGAHRTPCARRI